MQFAFPELLVELCTFFAELIMLNDESVAETAIRELLEKSRRPRTPTKTSTLIITSVKRVSRSAVLLINKPPPLPISR